MLAKGITTSNYSLSIIISAACRTPSTCLICNLRWERRGVLDKTSSYTGGFLGAVMMEQILWLWRSSWLASLFSRSTFARICMTVSIACLRGACDGQSMNTFIFIPARRTSSVIITTVATLLHDHWLIERRCQFYTIDNQFISETLDDTLRRAANDDHYYMFDKWELNDLDYLNRCVALKEQDCHCRIDDNLPGVIINRGIVPSNFARSERLLEMCLLRSML